MPTCSLLTHMREHRLWPPCPRLAVLAFRIRFARPGGKCSESLGRWVLSSLSMLYCIITCSLCVDHITPPPPPRRPCFRPRALLSFVDVPWWVYVSLATPVESRVLSVTWLLHYTCGAWLGVSALWFGARVNVDERWPAARDMCTVWLWFN